MVIMIDSFIKKDMLQTIETINALSHLECSSCGKKHSATQLQTYALCCNKPLAARYDMNNGFSKSELYNRENNMWRYAEMLPVFNKENIVTLGEGMTPILHLNNIGNKYDLPFLYVKDESNNPTGSFKARGISAAISKAKEFGVQQCIIPTAGNAGGAMAAYCAAAGISATVVMPSHTPAVFKNECELYGAKLLLVNGLISDCGKKVRELNHAGDYFDISTFKEPFRLEGKKTLGYEIAEQFDWELPDVILYPTGGGTGLVGIWKAFEEMIALGWITDKLPRMIAVQAENCKPIVATWNKLQPDCKNYEGQPSLANGLAVPHPFAEDMILEVLKTSGGTTIAVTDEDMIAAVKEICKAEGLFLAPEGGALLTALLNLIETGQVNRTEKILMLNTGSGYKYLENIV